MKYINNYKLSCCLLVVNMMVFSSCKKFLDIDLTDSQVTTDVVFSDENTANAAMIGLYFDFSTGVTYSGDVNNMSRLAGLSADELKVFYEDNDIIHFQNNDLRPDNLAAYALWKQLFKIVYETNSIIEGVTASDKLPGHIKNRLTGEAKFIRAFCNFYLVNFFGDIPIITSTDYRVNSAIKRMDRSEVYESIVADLIAAEALLQDEYIPVERTRANSKAATALLAKVYLYLEDWENAEAKASSVIDDTQYEIVQDFTGIFIKESREAIWQIAPPLQENSMTDEARFYVIIDAPQYLVLRDTIVHSFETADKRLLNWIGSVTVDDQPVYYPHKYTIQDAGLPVKEYSIVLRLSEQLLIRAEARARQNDLAGAIADVDRIRERAGVSLVADENPSIGQEALLLLIEKERKLELFTEWGNRWFDLKRLQKAGETLQTIKPDFTSTDVLYPIPQAELERNRNLGDQNPGY